MSQPAVKPNFTTQPVRTRYEDDVYTWAVEQASGLRASSVRGLDSANIAEELEDVARREYDKLESALTVLMMHMLKWDHQPERVTRSWDNSIVEQRSRYTKLIQRNPGLKPSLDIILDDAYRAARIRASTETDIPRDDFPSDRPYTLSDVLERSFEYRP